MGADYIATGHYVRREYDAPTRQWILQTGVDRSKDQSYALYNMTQEQMAQALFPLGNYRKSEIREIAREAGLPVAHKEDSQDICFVEGSPGDFVEKYVETRKIQGDIIDSQGNILGRHRGIYRYTIGQRKGLGITAGSPVYIIKINPESNTIQVGKNTDLFHSGLLAENMHWISGKLPELPGNISAKIRYNASKVAASLQQVGNGIIEVTFEKAQRAITPGQAVVIYEGEKVLGGGTIIAPI
jgi:tRNA-specific 2-thiouridylase